MYCSLHGAAMNSIQTLQRLRLCTAPVCALVDMVHKDISSPIKYLSASRVLVPSLAEAAGTSACGH